MFDILIKNGRIVDGSGAPAYTADLAIKDEKIVKIAPVIESEAKECVDAAGLTVTPGFIDTHTHSDSILLTGSPSYNYLQCAVTTQIAGQCGSSPTPYCERRLNGIKKQVSAEEFEACKLKAASPKSFMAAGREAKIGINIALFAGQSTIRQYVCGFDPSVPTPEKLEEMKAIVREAMESGFLGFSTGLAYTPSVYAKTEELIELAKVVHEYGGVYVSHIRDEGAHILDAVEEALRIGKEADVPVWISHMKISGKGNVGLSGKLLDRLEQARKDGQAVYADQYPYTAGSAPLMSQVPPRFLTGGVAAALESFKDPAVRTEILRAINEETDVFESLVHAAGFEGSVVTAASATPQYVNKSLAQIAEEKGLSPIDGMLELLRENDGTVQGSYFSQNPSDMMRIMAAPYVFAGMDSSDRKTDFPEDKLGGAHPRGIGTMVKRLELERDYQLHTLEETVKNLAYEPARILGLKNIGQLKEGWNADIAVLDYENLHARANYEHPYRKNEGVIHVIVNGVFGLKYGEYTGARAGKLKKRGE